MEFRFDVIKDSLPFLLEGLELTIIITLVGLLIGFCLGALFGMGKLSRKVLVRKLSGAYVEGVRGTPLMVQVMFLYFALPSVLKVLIPKAQISPLAAGITAIGLNSGAYIAEIVRGAVQSISKGQMEAARSIGLTHFQAMRYVIWPQAFRRMIPPLGNQFIISLKDTSLLVIIGVSELTRRGQELTGVTFRALEIWLTVALLYLCITLSISKILQITERRLLKKT